MFDKNHERSHTGDSAVLRKIFSLETRVWTAGVVNVLAWALQPETVIRTRNVSGLSVPMLILGIYIQLTFAQLGWKQKEWGQFWGMAIGAILTSAVLLLTFVY